MNETVSQSVLEEKSQGQSVGRSHGGSVGNEDVDGSYGERDFDINMEVAYRSDGEPDDVSRRQNGVVGSDNRDGDRDLNLQPSGRRTALAGKWGSSFWKDCQPMVGPGGSDSGHDSKFEYKNDVEGSEGNSTDDRDNRLESDDEGQKGVGKGQRGHSDVPAEEMLSDEYYEQDGEDQSDSMHYRGFSHSVEMSSRPQSKPVAVSNNLSRRSRASNSREDDDDDGENNDDADYEDEDEDDGNLLQCCVPFGFSFSHIVITKSGLRLIAGLLNLCHHGKSGLNLCCLVCR